jgi:hypothetical protein
LPNRISIGWSTRFICKLAEARIDQFTGGHIEAAIIIEVGLNYDYAHLAGDHGKLIESKAAAGYLVDLRRVGQPDRRSEALICNLAAQVKGAYAYAPVRGEKALKHIADRQMSYS